MNDLILYTTEDGRSQIKLRAQHVKSIFEEGELEETSVVKQHFTTAADGKRYQTLLYNLDAILRAKSKQEMRMAFWKQNVDQIITSNGFPLLAHAGSISHEQMELKTSELYLDYDQRRKTQEAQAADQEDEADLKALETKIKRRRRSEK
jgi:hypothetical protein